MDEDEEMEPVDSVEENRVENMFAGWKLIDVLILRSIFGGELSW